MYILINSKKEIIETFKSLCEAIIYKVFNNSQRTQLVYLDVDKEKCKKFTQKDISKQTRAVKSLFNAIISLPDKPTKEDDKALTKAFDKVAEVFKEDTYNVIKCVENVFGVKLISDT